MRTTFIMSLPRSRTAWIAQTYYPWAWTLHDPLKRCESIAELRKYVDSLKARNPNHPVVVADTSAVFFYPQIAREFPDARFVFLVRPYSQVVRSVMRAGQSTEMLDSALAHFSKARHRAPRDGFWSVDVSFADLNRVDMLDSLAKFFGIEAMITPGYFEDSIEVNVQIPFDEQKRNTDKAKVLKLFATRHVGW
jgi:hypothetical protein